MKTNWNSCFTLYRYKVWYNMPDEDFDSNGMAWQIAQNFYFIFQGDFKRTPLPWHGASDKEKW